MKNTLQISFLGQVSVLYNNKIVKLQSKQATLLLAYLIENPTSHSRSSLSALLWPEREESEALGLLRTLLSRLQKKVPELFIIDRYSVSADSLMFAESVWVDTIQFERLANANDTKSWQAALEHYRGNFLNGFDSGFSNDIRNWLDQKREDYTLKYSQVLKKLVDIHFVNANPDLGIRYTQTWLELDNYNEEAHRYLLQFYGMKGDFIAAKNHFSILTQTFAEELGIGPEERTIDCFNHISLIQDTHNPNTLKPKASILNSLPFKGDDFVGREKDIKALSTIFEKQSLVTLCAWGGVGKTRLAIEYAQRYKHQFKDGVLYVSLANQRYDNVLEYFREMLQLGSSEQSDILEDLKHFFATRHLLLVLDNAEEYIEELIVLNQFLEVSPLLKILVTSRTNLGLRTEYKYDVQGLSLPVAESDLRSNESYSLLNNKAALNGITNRLDDEVLFQLLQLSEGMPLVIEMIAMWLTVLPIDKLTKLEDLYTLDLPLKDADDRHKTIERCFEYSWSLLSSESQNLIAAASISHTTLSFSSLQAITGATTKDIFTLTQSSFLSRDENGNFVQHALVKHFCRQKLEANAQHFQKIQENYISYYTHKAEVLRASYTEDQTLVVHDVNIDNLWDVACLLVKQGHADRITYFVSTLAIYNLFVNDFVRGRDQLEHLLELIEKGRQQGQYEAYSDSENMSFQIVLTSIYSGLIHINSNMGNVQEAERILTEHGEQCCNTIAILKRVQPEFGLFHECVLNYFTAHLLTVRGKIEQSKELLDTILNVKYKESSEMPTLLLSVRILQSYNYIYEGEYNKAITLLKVSIDNHDEFDLRVLTYSNLAMAHLGLQQIEEARQYITLALADAEATNFQLLTYDIHFNSALTMLSEKRYEEAEALIEQTNSSFFSHPSKRNRYDYRYNSRYFYALTRAYVAQNKFEALETVAKQAIIDAREHDDTVVLQTALFYYAITQTKTNPERAKQSFDYVNRHPQTPFFIKHLAGLELDKLSETTVDVFNTLTDISEPYPFLNEII